jgi:hypothetical protein
VLVVRTGTGFSEPVVYTDNIAMIFLLILSVADVRNKDLSGSRNSELKAFVLRPEFVSSALFRRCDTLTFRGGFCCHGLVHNPPIRCFQHRVILHDR